jgi:hypothetical protein
MHAFLHIIFKFYIIFIIILYKYIITTLII